MFILFLKKFLLLFNYSCMPFLPIPPPHPSWAHLPPISCVYFKKLCCLMHPFQSTEVEVQWSVHALSFPSLAYPFVYPSKCYSVLNNNQWTSRCIFWSNLKETILSCSADFPVRYGAKEHLVDKLSTYIHTYIHVY